MKIIRYFFEFLVVVSLLSFFKIIGLKLASICGGLIGKVIGPIFRPKSIIQKNLNIAFNNNLSANQEKTIIENMWINYGKILGEYIHLKKFRKSLGNNSYVKIIGSRYLQEIKESKKPVVFFSGHFSNFELMAMELDKFNINLAALYRPLNNIFLKSPSSKLGGSIFLKLSKSVLNNSLALVPLTPPIVDTSTGITLSLYFFTNSDLCLTSI